MDLYLHIGTEKTGTTAIQRFLADNRAALREAGILYPDVLGDRSQKALVLVGQDRDQARPQWHLCGVRSHEDFESLEADVRAGLARETEGGDFSRVIMSSEHCSSRLRDEEESARLHEFLRKYFDRIRIVVYLRRQDDFLLSTYSTSVKTGHTGMLSLPGPRSLKRRYDFEDLLSRWVGVFGRENIICRRYERASLIGGDVLEDFMDATGIGPGGSYRKPPNMNESLDADALEFLRILNGQPWGEIPRRGVVTALAEISKGPLLSLPEEELSAFMASRAETNRRVAIEYFGGTTKNSDDPLFQPRSDPRPRRTYEPLNAERAVRMAFHLWQRANPVPPSRSPDPAVRKQSAEAGERMAKRRKLRKRKRDLLEAAAAK